MRETRADTTQAFVYAIALHVLLFLLAFVGLWWTRSTAPVSAAGPMVEAELIDPNALSAQMKRVLRERPKAVPPEPVQQPQAAEEEATPPPQPLPEPRPQDSQVPQQNQAQEQIPIPDTREQERVDREAISAEQREREQEEKRRQEQIDLTERERQQEAEEKQRLAQQQKDEELKKIRAEIAKAKREEDLAQQRLKQLADRRAQQASSDAASSASPPPGNEGVDTDLAAKYAAALQEAILRNWTRPETVPLGQRCRLNIRQLPGGEVVDVQVSPSCPYDELGRRSVEAAVLKAQPLPYAGFETVFQRNLTLNFEAQDR
ncbi:cell envelope integrity protein TolA [Luteimonas sp. SX5]|uniref:Cell envelope integrity protein TolA n=1 Tax=Luteimonas galliterrae TaxID=2940486 RepID=A0ABT0MI17_9GAMM|nr:cell envelope integrity protein TolA [Luteimonas galliterrae]